jgi:hypothetical protein
MARGNETVVCVCVRVRVHVCLCVRACVCLRACVLCVCARVLERRAGLAGSSRPKERAKPRSLQRSHSASSAPTKTTHAVLRSVPGGGARMVWLLTRVVRPLRLNHGWPTHQLGDWFMSHLHTIRTPCPQRSSKGCEREMSEGQEKLARTHTHAHTHAHARLHAHTHSLRPRLRHRRAFVQVSHESLSARASPSDPGSCPPFLPLAWALSVPSQVPLSPWLGEPDPSLGRASAREHATE